MRTNWEFRWPWQQHWPISAGFNFVLFSIGFFRFAGGGYGGSLSILSTTLEFKRWPNSFDPEQGYVQQQIKRDGGNCD